MTTWTEDPELVETFRAEVLERIGSLQAGLLALETEPATRQTVTALFRDAHTVKGSARMMGLHGVLAVAHRSEDILGAIRDGRLQPRRDIVDLLLAACDAVAAALPGVEEPIPDEHLHDIAAAMQRAIAGEQNLTVPSRRVLVTGPDEPATAAESPDAQGEPVRGPESVRVTADKVYELLDVVGEAELDSRRVESTGATLHTLAVQHARWLRKLRDAVAALELPTDAGVALTRLTEVGDRLTETARELRELTDEAHGRLTQVRDGAMGLAMVPIRRLVSGLPRVVRDVASASGKDVALRLEGQDVELDKHVLDGVSDALKHLVVNAVDHGCETPLERVRRGKPGQATVTVAARSAGGAVVVEVSDDGAGIDEAEVRAAAIGCGALPEDTSATGSALLSVLFQPGFSTAEAVTETSGRGVGLDVVRIAVEQLGGTVELRSEPGAGTTFTLTLPVTLGVLRCLMARVGAECYALPLAGIVESLSLQAGVHSLVGHSVVVRNEQSIPLVDLGAALGVDERREPGFAVVARHGERLVAWAVDSLEGERELVVKELGGFLGRPPLVTGATIDDDGTVVFLLDLRELSETVSARPAATGSQTVVGTAVVMPAIDGQAGVPGVADRAPRLLVVEDAVGVRELERAILESAGFEVVTAIDGLAGAAHLAGEPFDLVVTDVEMPGIDGFELTRKIRQTTGWEQVPIVVMTSRDSEADQRAGMDAGASAYLLKTQFDQQQLVATVTRLLGR